MAANDRQEGGNHYNVKKYIQQHWDYAWDHEYDQFQYCITKYVDRHKYKNGLKDLYKARHHLEKYIELLEAQEKQKIVDRERAGLANNALLDRYGARDLAPGVMLGAQTVDPGRTYVNPDL